ncbi:YadA family autotransporter adhesin [Burkholderia cepacia]|uniref:YadA family autotransporter adhesin n=1 Tax=Burkholderia cepacia TaxID=292 RepID=UPI001E656372|nr:YadA-like family protein [Burkholderia cepacia]
MLGGRADPSLTKGALTRRLTNMSAGIAGTDAVNVSQLTPVVSALGGGASIDATTGAVRGPTYALENGGTQTTVGGALGALDGALTTTNNKVTDVTNRVTTTEGNISTLQQQIKDGTTGLVQQAGAGANLTVGMNSGGTAVNFTGTDGARQLKGVANGTDDHDAVTLAQLKATGLVDKDGKSLGALVYDDLTLKNVTLGGVGGTHLNNVAPGMIGAGSMQAINGGQLYDMQQQFAQQFNSLDNRVSKMEEGGGSGGGGGVEPGTGGAGSIVVGDGADASGANSSALGQGAVASGDKSSVLGQGAQATGQNTTAVGQGAAASGSGSTAMGQGANASAANSTALGQGAHASAANSTALGQGANATGKNSVALGAGSVASRDNSVSVGAPGAERQITNVADGTAPTDAANMRQLNAVRGQMGDVARKAYSGIAAATALTMIPDVDQGKTIAVGLAGGSYQGYAASAVGFSARITQNLKIKGGVGFSGAGGATFGGGASYQW